MQNNRERSARTAELVAQLHSIVHELEQMHPGRKFPMDGHIVGSIGEAAAEAAFDLDLVGTGATGHDAIAGDGRRVEIKATYGNTGVSIRQTSQTSADALIVLKLSDTPDTEHEVVFNGPLSVAMSAAGAPQSNGQSKMSLSRLRVLDATVPPHGRVPTRQGNT